MSDADLESRVEWFLANRVTADDLRELTLFMCERAINKQADELKSMSREKFLEFLDNEAAHAAFKKQLHAEATPVMAQWLRDKGYEI